MLTGIEKSLIKVQEVTIYTIKMLLDGKSIDEIAAALNVPVQNVKEIKEKFEAPT